MYRFGKRRVLRILIFCALLYTLAKLITFFIATADSENHPSTITMKHQLAKPENIKQTQNRESSLFHDILTLAADVTFVGCSQPIGNKVTLRLEPTDCSLFCIGRGFQYVGVRESAGECFCTNEVTSSNSQTCSETDFEMFSLESRQVPFKTMGGAQFFVGCLNKDFITHEGALSSSVAETNVLACIANCDAKLQTIAVFLERSAKNVKNCFCFEKFLQVFDAVDQSETDTCSVGKVYITEAGFSLCSTERAVERTDMPSNVPIVGLVTIPGSGTTWVRYLFQRAAGVLSGSIYSDASSAHKGLKGEVMPWNTGRVTFVKNHEGDEKFDPNGSGNTYYHFMEKFVIVIRNPFLSTLAEFNERFNGHTGQFKSTADFQRRADSTSTSYRSVSFPKTFQQQIERGLSHFRVLYATNKPLLAVSYEDIKQNKLSQILRLLLFFNLHEGEESKNRAICSYYEDFRSAPAKRQKRLDLEALAASYLNETYYENSVKLFDNLLKEKGIHFLRTEEYIASIHKS